MKRIKTTDIVPGKLITKARYAAKMGISQTTVQNRIAAGELTIVVADGAELIHE